MENLLPLIILGLVSGINAETLLHETKLGRILGVVGKSVPNSLPFVSFHSIPFAKPPVGELRFKDPVPLVGKTWGSEVRDGTKPPPVCPQWSWKNRASLQDDPFTGNEDCLYLNIHVPKSALEESKHLPVMVYIHGGGFFSGSGNTGGPKYFMDTEEVVLVTVNYRLGALGWMSMEDDVIPGNMGLKDQAVALKWVRENIQDFMGDSKQVTLFGESAGGMSIMNHLVSPWSKGLFDQIISQSGPVVNSPSMQPSQGPSYYASTFCEAVGCDISSSTDEILNCLQSKSTEELLDKSRMFERYLFIPNPWKPMIDVAYSSKPFLPQSIKSAFENGDYYQVPMIVGHDKDEGAMFLPQFLNNPKRMLQMQENFDKLGPVLLMTMDEHAVTNKDSEIANMYRKQYLNGSFSEENALDISRMMGDVRYTGPIHMGVDLLRKTNKKPVYYYMYSFRGAVTLTDYLGHKRSDLDLGTCHSDELYLLFNGVDSGADEKVLASPQDLAMSRKIVRIWVSFAKNGIPDSDWTPVNGKDKSEFAVLDDQPIRMKLPEEFLKRMEFLEEMAEFIQTYRQEKKLGKEEKNGDRDTQTISDDEKLIGSDFGEFDHEEL